MKHERFGFVIYVLIFASMLIPSSAASSQTSQWIRTLGGPEWEGMGSLVATAEGGFLVSGGTFSFGAGLSDAWVVKLDTEGVVEWEKAFGRPNQEYFLAALQTRSGEYVLAGAVTSPFGSDSDVWLLKLGSGGEFQWKRQFGGPGTDTARAIAETQTGDYVVVGYTKSFGAGEYDAFVLAVDTNGRLQWQKTYGSAGEDEFYSIQASSDGGLIAVGDTGYFGTGNCGLLEALCADLWVVKLDSAGGIEWERSYGGSRADYATAVHQMATGDYLVAGATASFDPRQSGIWEGSCGFLDTACFDLWVLRINPSGTVKWQRRYAGDSYDAGSSIQETRDGDIVVGGSTSSFNDSASSSVWDAWLLKLTREGNITWQKRFDSGAIDGGLNVQEIHRGYAALANGSTNSPDDFRILKLDKYGLVGDCPLIHPTNGVAYATSVDSRPTRITVSDVEKPEIENPEGMKESPTTSTVTELCYYENCREALTDFGPSDYAGAIDMCVQWPSGVGVGRPERCAPVFCPDCAFRFSSDAVASEIPDDIVDIYTELSSLGLMTRSPRLHELPTAPLEKLAERFSDIATGRYFSEKMKAELVKGLPGWNETAAGFLGAASRALNAIELDLAAPSPATRVLEAGKLSAGDLDGVTWLTARRLERSGEVSLRIEAGHPARIEGYVPTWPLATYELGFTGTLEPEGFFDLTIFVGGLGILEEGAEIRLLEWNGQCYRDITISYDAERRTVTGRTQGLSNYVIATSGRSDRVRHRIR